MTSAISSLSLVADALSPDIGVTLSRVRLPGARLSSVDPPDVPVGPAARGGNEIQNDHCLIDRLAEKTDGGELCHALLEVLLDFRVDLATGMAERAEVGWRGTGCDRVDP